MNILVEYDDTTDELTFYNDDFKICTVPEAKFNKTYSKVSNNLHTEFLPLAVRGMFKSKVHKDTTYIIYQQRPQYMRFNYSPETQGELQPDGDSAKGFLLPMPWMLFGIELSRSYSIKNIYGYITRGESDEIANTFLYRIPLHNWYLECNLCRPIYQNIMEEDADVFSIVSRVHNEVWASGFNNDLHDNVDGYIHRSCMRREGDDGTMDSFIPREYKENLAELFSKERNLAYLQYYTLWANTDIETMMNCDYESVGSFRDVFWYIDPTQDQLENHGNGRLAGPDLDYVTTLLTSAQNSSMD